MKIFNDSIYSFDKIFNFDILKIIESFVVIQFGEYYKGKSKMKDD